VAKVNDYVLERFARERMAELERDARRAQFPRPANVARTASAASAAVLAVIRQVIRRRRSVDLGASYEAGSEILR